MTNGSSQQKLPTTNKLVYHHHCWSLCCFTKKQAGLPWFTIIYSWFILVYLWKKLRFLTSTSHPRPGPRLPTFANPAVHLSRATAVGHGMVGVGSWWLMGDGWITKRCSNTSMLLLGISWSMIASGINRGSSDMLCSPKWLVSLLTFG